MSSVQGSKSVWLVSHTSVQPSVTTVLLLSLAFTLNLPFHSPEVRPSRGSGRPAEAADAGRGGSNVRGSESVYAAVAISSFEDLTLPLTEQCEPCFCFSVDTLRVSRWRGEFELRGTWSALRNMGEELQRSFRKQPRSRFELPSKARRGAASRRIDMEHAASLPASGGDRGRTSCSSERYASRVL